MKNIINGLKNHKTKTQPKRIRKIAVALVAASGGAACVPAQNVLPVDANQFGTPIPYSSSDFILRNIPGRFLVQHGPGYVTEQANESFDKSILITVFDPALYNIEHITTNGRVSSPKAVPPMRYWAVYNGDFFANGRESPKYRANFGTPYGPARDMHFDNTKPETPSWGYFAISNQNIPSCSRPNEEQDLSNEKFVVGSENQPYIIDGQINPIAVAQLASSQNESSNRTVIGVVDQKYVLIGAFKGYNRGQVLDLLRGSAVKCANSLDSGSSTYGAAAGSVVAGNDSKVRTLLGITP